MEAMDPPSKRLCTNGNKKTAHIPTDSSSCHNESSSKHIDSLKDFKVQRILNNISDKCSVAVEGNFGNSSEKAVILLQKLPFSEEKLEEIFLNISNLRLLFKNDIYSNQTAYMPPELNEIKVDTIYPAEEKHIKKYQKEISSFVYETPELYESITLPFIKSSSYSMQWIYNILEHKTEVERIVCEDLDPTVGFVMVPDMKWTGEQMENLYLQAIVLRRDLKSIRDLRGEHLSLLQNVYDKCTKAILEKYGVPSSKLRIYFHYQPSFYHLHVHFCALSFDAPGTWTGKAHLLRDVISILKCDPDFYAKAVIGFTVKDNHPLRVSFQKQGYFD